MKNIKIGILIFFIVSFHLFSGCIEFFYVNIDGYTYVSHPIKISYNISYGYSINLSGEGSYLINYKCNLPELLQGSVSSKLLHNKDYLDIEIANNSFIFWNISAKEYGNYDLGIISNVTSQSYLISDLNGKNALTINQIKKDYPNIINQYCKSQGDNTLTYIDPDNSLIKNTAQKIFESADSTNSFILAKELFKWLKENTEYRTHQEENKIQPSYITYKLKSGDCDDLSILYISLCRSIGIPARFVSGYLIEEKNGIAQAIGHAWSEVFVGKNVCDSGWIPVECSCCASVKAEVHQNFGIEDAYHLRLFIDDGSNNSINASISGPSVIYDEKINVEMLPFFKIENYNVLEFRELIIDKENNRYYQ